MLTSSASSSETPARPIAWSDQVAALAIVELDSEGIVRSWNAGAERIKGYRREEIVGVHFSRFYRPEDKHRGVPEALLSSALENGYVEDTGWRIRADGDLFWAHVTITSVRNSQGQSTGFVKIVRDLTASKRADDERNAFLRSFVHDFLSPVTAVRGYVDLLGEGGPDAPELLARLSEATEHLVSMTQTLAQRVRENPAPRTIEPVSASVLVQEAASLVLPGDLHGRLSFTVGEDAFICVDSTDVRRALQNVLENAAKYAEGAIHVLVEADEDAVEITVRDDGRGIHPDDLDLIFHDGQRGRLARPDDGGSGIGLASALQAIEAEGGSIRLESELGQGTTARIRLPRFTPDDLTTAA